MAERVGHPEGGEAFSPSLAIGLLVAAKLGIHLATNGNYGYFIDELYYLACGEHLAWGYVDHPPMIGLVAWLARTLFGESLPGLRFLPALVGALTILLTAALAHELGGGRRAQVLAAFAALFAPLFLYSNTTLSMNPFDVAFCTGALLVLARILRRGETAPGPWALLGVILGLGLMTKISVLFLGFGLFVGLLATPARQHFRHAGPWLAGGIAFLMFLPHLIWQVRNDWPTLEFMRNAAAEKNRALPLWEFLATLAQNAAPFAFLLMASGLYVLLRRSTWRPLGILAAVVIAVMVAGNGKPYYLGVLFPLLFAAGAAGLDPRAAPERRRPRLAQALTVAIVLTGLVLAPLALPILPIETFIRYQRAVFGETPASSENKEVGALPQHYADMFGNEELVADIAKVWQSLDPAEQAKTAIYGESYPQAGAVDLFGQRYGLPKAASGHNSYYLWGPPNDQATTWIVAGGDLEDLLPICESVSQVATSDHPLAMPWRRHYPIFLCRGMKLPIRELWPETKEYV